MSGESGRHEAVAGELAEWWEDLCGGIGSRVVLLAVPPAWGRSAVLDKFRAVVEDLDAPVTLVVCITVTAARPRVTRCRRSRCGRR